MLLQPANIVEPNVQRIRPTVGPDGVLPSALVGLVPIEGGFRYVMGVHRATLVSIFSRLVSSVADFSYDAPLPGSIYEYG